MSNLIDIVLLRIMKYKKDYMLLSRAIPIGTIDERTETLLRNFGKYFQKFPSHEQIDLTVFIPRFKNWNPGMAQDTFNLYIAILKNAMQDVDEDTRKGILSELFEIDLQTQVANICAEYEQGNLETPLGSLIEAQVDKYKRSVGTKEHPWEDTDIDELIKQDENNEGITWRLECLREVMRPMRAGDFIIVGARPDRGKTTFFADQLTHMAAQLPEDKNVIWLNNEEVSGRIVKRVYQAALDETIPNMVKLSRAGKLKKAYKKVVGRMDKIRVIDCREMTMPQIEQIFEGSNPGVVVFDLMDNIKGFADLSRTDLSLEETYKWGRNMANKYQFVGIAGSQISADGEGEKFPDMSKLKDSKTGKQGACDAIIMIGASNQPELANSRFISVPKNKLGMSGKKKCPRAEVLLDFDRARYKEIVFDGVTEYMEDEAAEPTKQTTKEVEEVEEE